MPRRMLILGLATAVAGCAVMPGAEHASAPAPAPQAVPSHASASSSARSYYRCVSDAALPLARVPQPALRIARLSAQRCQATLDAVAAGLREENAGLAFADAYALAYTASLKRHVVRDVAKGVAQIKAH